MWIEINAKHLVIVLVCDDYKIKKMFFCLLFLLSFRYKTPKNKRQSEANWTFFVHLSLFFTSLLCLSNYQETKKKIESTLFIIEFFFRCYSYYRIGVEFGTRIIEVGGQKIKLQIWDTAGQVLFCCCWFIDSIVLIDFLANKTGKISCRNT